MGGLRLPASGFRRLEQITQMMPIQFDPGDWRVRFRRRVTYDVVRAFAAERHQNSVVGQLSVETSAAQSTDKRGGVFIQLDPQELRAFREFRDRAGVLEFAELDGDEEIADALDFAEEVRGDDDGDAELAAGALY
jgi:hypothetical protein